VQVLDQLGQLVRLRSDGCAISYFESVDYMVYRKTIGRPNCQRRRHKMAGKTEARSRRPPSRRVRRGLSGHLYQEEDDEDEIESIALEPIQNRTEQERIFSEDQELGSWQPATEAMAVSSLETAAQERATTVPERQPIDKLPAPSQDLLSPNNLAQSLILVQVLSEPPVQANWAVTEGCFYTMSAAVPVEVGFRAHSCSLEPELIMFGQ
jgi:hypothetical protein